MHDMGVSPGDRWDSLGRLWERATAGRDVAANPTGHGTFWPQAPAAPGVDEAALWLESGLAAAAGPQRILFLVGGPGSGKSHTASRIVRGLPELSRTEDGLAHRTYRYKAGPRELLLVNDATIGSEVHQVGALAGDLSDALTAGWHLLACVNRGIVVEELAAVSSSPRDIAAQLISWLHDGQVDSGSFLPRLVPLTSSAFLRTAQVEFIGRKVEVVCVLMDACSLLESRPSVTLQEGEATTSFKAAYYRVSRIDKRPDVPEESIPAATLLREVISTVQSARTGADAQLPVDPVAANLVSLSHPNTRANLLTVLRAAEIVAGKRLTYREVWGAASRCIVGNLTDRINAADLRAELWALQPGDVEPIERFSRLSRLADLRYSQAIFGVTSEGWMGNPVTRLTRHVDPARDAIPGRHDPSDPGGWATPVVDAFAAGGHAESPLESLLRDLPPDDGLHDTVTDFDRAVDLAFAAATTQARPKDRVREAMTAWYGSYLLRLYAVSNGIPAFCREVHQWTLAWSTSPSLPDRLKSQLSTLLLPRRNPDSPTASFLLPVYDSRTAPILGAPAEPRLAIRGKSVDLSTETDGDSLVLVLRDAGHDVARIECDFAMMREALSCAEGHVGTTEYTDSATPRLERVRAARLAPARLADAQYCLVVGDTEEAVTVEAP